MRKILFFTVFLVIYIIVFAQYYTLWTETYGGTSAYSCNAVTETSDSCYLFAGTKYASPASGDDFWLVKTDLNGDTLWTKTYIGDLGNEYCTSVIETSDSCYLLVGSTESYGAGGFNYWIIKTNSNGDTIWTKTFGGNGYEQCNSVIETSDSCYLFAGVTQSYGAGYYDFWLIKTDTDGDTLWTKTYGRFNEEDCQSVIETSDSCYLLAGYTFYTPAQDYDYWFVKTNADGDTLWTRSYGGTGIDYCYSVIETSDSCYLFGGSTKSYGAGASDFWLIKTDTNGDSLWTKTYGGTGNECCYSIIETYDSCYLQAGYTYSYGAGNSDFWLVKTNSDGDTICTDTYGGTGSENCYSIIETNDFYYLMGGCTNSYGAGGYDFWIIKTVNPVLSGFSIIEHNDYVSTDTISFDWHPSYSKKSFSYEFSLNSIPDTVSQADTLVKLGDLPEGEYIWFVTAVNDYGYRTQSNNTDTFWVDRTPPAVFTVENIPDTNFSGPYKLRVMAEDTLADIDSIVIYYMLPGDSVWSKVLTTEKSMSWYTGYIPEAAQTGYAYYYLELFDKAVPTNYCRYPDYPGLLSFEITGLTGLTEQSEKAYALDIGQFSNAGISFTLPDNSPVSISVYDINGRVVLNKSMTMPKGNHTINLDIMPGVYFAKVNTPYGNAEQKIVNIQ